MRTWTVGEVARRAGLSVRALHHYDAIGLLAPSRRSAAGYRLYAAEDLERLLQILSLRQAGLSLAEIGECLEHPGGSLLATLRLHVARLEEDIELKGRLRSRLAAVARRLERAETVSAEDFLQTMEAITMFERHFSEEQLEKIDERGRRLGAERIREVEAEWPRLIARVRAEMEKGTDPASEAVQRLARRWGELVREFSGGDPGIEKGVAALYREEPAARQRTGLDPAICEYIGRAAAAAREEG